MEVTALPQRSTDELAVTIDRLHGLMCAAERQMLAVVAEYERRRAYEEDGAASMTAWLAYRLAASHQTASRWARTARRLESLPALSEAFGEGRLSHDQVVALAGAATPETDAALAQEGPGWSAARCQALARRVRRVTPADAAEAHRRRSLRWQWDTEGRMLQLSGRLPAEAGATVVAAIERVAEAAKPDPATGVFDPYEARAADALVELASSHLGAASSPHRATVVVHADVAALTGGAGVVEVEGGPSLDVEALRRQACDCRLELAAHGPGGALVGVGRARRTIPGWMNRALRHRDGGCRFPGCERRRWVHGHHILFWADGGGTDLANLVSLCPFHHRLVHEGGWRIHGEPEGELTFVRPGGRPLRR